MSDKCICTAPVWRSDHDLCSECGLTLPNADHFNGLAPGEHERLSVLLEEMGEAQQAIGKILRHGYESRNPLQKHSPSNRQALALEIGHVVYAIGELERLGDIDKLAVKRSSACKRWNIQRWLHHAESSESTGGKA